MSNQIYPSALTLFLIIRIMKSNFTFMFYIAAAVVGLDHPMTALAWRDVGPTINQM